jgi:hypothetical protein
MQTAAPANRTPKTDPVELSLMRSLRKLLRNRTNADMLRNFLYSLNDTLTTAYIAQALDRIEAEAEKAAAADARP